MEIRKNKLSHTENDIDDSVTYKRECCKDTGVWDSFREEAGLGMRCSFEKCRSARFDRMLLSGCQSDNVGLYGPLSLALVALGLHHLLDVLDAILADASLHD